MWLFSASTGQSAAVVSSSLLSLLFAVGLSCAGVFAISRYLRDLQREGLAVARALAKDEDVVVVDQRTNFFGVGSVGAVQARGNGCLLATSTHLHFAQWVPKRELSIRRSRIIAVERARSHHGKTTGRELLKIRFQNEQGGDDDVAFLVSDLPAWERALQLTRVPVSAVTTTTDRAGRR